MLGSFARSRWNGRTPRAMQTGTWIGRRRNTHHRLAAALQRLGPRRRAKQALLHVLCSSGEARHRSTNQSQRLCCVAVAQCASDYERRRRTRTGCATSRRGRIAQRRPCRFARMKWQWPRRQRIRSEAWPGPHRHWYRYAVLELAVLAQCMTCPSCSSTT